MSGHMLPLVACDRCGEEVLGASSATVASLRRGLRASGWRVQLGRDSCPNCIRRAAAPAPEGAQP